MGVIFGYAARSPTPPDNGPITALQRDLVMGGDGGRYARVMLIIAGDAVMSHAPVDPVFSVTAPSLCTVLCGYAPVTW